MINIIFKFEKQNIIDKLKLEIGTIFFRVSTS